MQEDLHNSMHEKTNPQLFYLNDCLTYYFFQQKMSETPKDFYTVCSKCKNIPKNLSKTQEIKSFPNILCIHLNRFSQNEKNNIFVDFPCEDLSLSDFFDVKKKF